VILPPLVFPGHTQHNDSLPNGTRTFMLIGFMLKAVMLSVFLLNAVMLSFFASYFQIAIAGCNDKYIQLKLHHSVKMILS
jgi:hypothetical protein